MFTIEYRDHVDKERVLVETDDHSAYVYGLLVIASDPDRYEVIKADPFVIYT